jgi:sortase A
MQETTKAGGAGGDGRYTNRTRQFLSYVLLAFGIVLIFLGARVLLESHFAQSAAARDFDKPADPEPAAIARGPRTGDTVLKLIIPRLDAQFYVMEGNGERELRRGPGHLSGTAMPGARGNCVIAGHRDTHFRILKHIRKGDDIVLQNANGQYLYRVKNTQVVSPQNTRALQPTAGPVLNLITCYPFLYVGSAPKRFVVEARLAGEVAISAGVK